MDAETRDAFLRTGIRALQSETDKSCIAVIAGPDFCTLIHADNFEQVWYRILESAPDTEQLAEVAELRSEGCYRIDQGSDSDE